MYAIATIGILALALMGFGYGFKKSYLLIASFPFWVGLGVYIAYNFTWLGAGQWAFTLLGFLVGIPMLIGSFYKKQVAQASSGLDNDEEWQDEDDESYGKEYKSYKKQSSVYKTKRVKRRNSLGLLR